MSLNFLYIIIGPFTGHSLQNVLNHIYRHLKVHPEDKFTTNKLSTEAEKATRILQVNNNSKLDKLNSKQIQNLI